MKNRLKFRVYSILDKKYLENLHFIDNDGDICFKSFNGVVRYENQENFIVEYDTGLKDKNGKEIFEGDICLYSDGSGGEIIFESGTFCFKNDNQIKLPLGYFANKTEIKGNIYEDSNLLDNK